MNDACRYENEILDAVEHDRWNETLRAHVASCEECAAAMAVAPFMVRFAALETRERALPDASAVWLKAHLLRGSAAVDRAARPMQMLHFIAYFLVAAGWAGLLTWKWSALQQWLLSVSPAHVLANAAAGSPLSVTFFLVVLVLSSMTIVLALHTILAEE
jgi:hypothetical protein